jgi:hypothetical protein
MARLKQMVKRSTAEIAKAKRTCKFTGQSIVKGTICMVIYDGTRDRACYSQKIALDMIQQARLYLLDLEMQLSGQAPT